MQMSLMPSVRRTYLTLFVLFLSNLTLPAQWSSVTSGTARPRPTPAPRPTPPVTVHWSSVPSGTTSNLNRAVLLNSGTGFAVGDNGTILKTTDAGATWTTLTSGTTSTLHGVDFLNPNEGFTVGDNGLILRTTDGGSTWQPVTSGVSDTLRAVSVSGLNGICGGDSQTILWSCDSGASWQVIQGGFFGGSFPAARMMSNSLFFLAGQNSISQPLFVNGMMSDCGGFWGTGQFNFDNNDGSCTGVFFFDQNIGFVSGVILVGAGAIARTTDGGSSWSTLLFNQAIQGITFAIPASGFAVGSGGRILHTTDFGVTWNDQTSVTSADLNDVCFTSDALSGIAVGEGGIILRTTPTPTPRPTSTPRVTPHPRPTPSDSDSAKARRWP